MSMRAIEDRLKKYSDKIDIITTDIMKDEHDETAIKFEKFLINQTKMTNKSKLYSNIVFLMSSQTRLNSVLDALSVHILIIGTLLGRPNNDVLPDTFELRI